VAVGRIGLIACALLAAYYLLPMDRPFTAGTVVGLVVGLTLVVVLLLWHVRAVLRSPRPVLRGVSALLTTILLFVLLFSATYYLMERSDPSTFNQSLTRTDALYFTVTVLSTVGFGDIVARSEGGRILTTCQIVLDLVLIGATVRILLSAVKEVLRERDDDSLATRLRRSGRRNDP
jgi:preprotein translocase subunit YajC